MKLVERSFGYWRGKPAMLLSPYGIIGVKPYPVPLQDAHKYSDTHNDNFMAEIGALVVEVCLQFGIQIPMRKQQFLQVVMSISDTIMDGIDGLVCMPPFTPGKDDALEADADYLLNEMAMRAADMTVKVMQ